MVLSIDEARALAIASVAQPGDWLTGAERCAAWQAARDPSAMPTELSRTDLDVVQRVAIDPGGLTREWADEAMAAIGEERYVELAGIAALTRAIDAFDQALGLPPSPIPSAIEGEPTETRPDGVGEVGAWVSQTIDRTRANVSRALSLVPATDAVWRSLVDSHYSRGAEFMSDTWDRALSRPQIELVAARTTALNECFY